jgi:D-lactate dehydrogenase (cytochrome)
LSEHGEAMSLMATLKKAIDPDNIMNPGKIVRL